MKVRPVILAVATGAAAAAVSLGSYVALAWLRYGRPRADRRPRDDLLDRFLPDPDVDEYHSVTVHAPAALTYAVARDLDLMGPPVVKAVFWLRALPTLLRGRPFRPGGPRGLVEETLALGWGVLAEVPDRQLVVGSYTQPWHQEVTFHALAPEEFRAFAEPAQVKIVWTLAVEPLGADACRFVTRTRALPTDDEARRLFRRYWAPMSTGIVLIRRVVVPAVRREAERRALTGGRPRPPRQAHDADATPGGERP